MLLFGLVLVVIFYFSFDYVLEFGFQKGEAELESKINAFSNDVLLQKVNNYRQEKNLPLLQKDSQLCQCAQIRASEIAYDYSHQKFAEYVDLYCPGCRFAGENLSKNFYTPKEVLDGWLESPTHKKELDFAYNIGCIGSQRDGYDFYVVLVMGAL